MCMRANAISIAVARTASPFSMAVTEERRARRPEISRLRRLTVRNPGSSTAMCSERTGSGDTSNADISPKD